MALLEQVFSWVTRPMRVKGKRAPAAPVLFSWAVAALADRDLFFQDRHVSSGWGPSPSGQIPKKALANCDAWL
jgi:hypothetical protein